MNLKQNGSTIFLKGGDLSMVSYVEAMGGKFYDEDDNESDVFSILKEKGYDMVRLRLYNNPGKGRGNGTYYCPEGFLDEKDILRLAKRAKNAGLKIVLSFHYSDYWTNGETQIIPNEWQNEIIGLSTDKEKIDKLVDLLKEYTSRVITIMIEQGTTPEFVSIGNEIQAGVLFPFGKEWCNLFQFLNAGYDAVKKVSPASKVIIHLDDAGNFDKYKDFFGNCTEYNVNYDIIGPSYYPFWTKKDVTEIVKFCNVIANEFKKDIMIMETGFNWNKTIPDGSVGQLSDNGPYSNDASTPEGQRDFMIELFDGLKSVRTKDGNIVIGDLYWDPVMIEMENVGWAIREEDNKTDYNMVSNTTQFDFKGKVLPVLDAYR